MTFKIKMPFTSSTGESEVLTIINAMKEAGSLSPELEAFEYLRLAKRLAREYKNTGIPDQELKEKTIKYVHKAQDIYAALFAAGTFDSAVTLDVIDLLAEIYFWTQFRQE